MGNKEIPIFAIGNNELKDLPIKIEQFLLKALATQRAEDNKYMKFWLEEAKRYCKDVHFWREKYRKQRADLIREVEEGLPKEKELTEYDSHFVDEEVVDRRNRENGYNQAIKDTKSFLRKIT